MRILSIKLKNINSLRGEHEVNFDASPLREAGLFGIVGATGAGKSTLLDCITLALYGRVPRIGQVTKSILDKGGVILTKHEKECYAEVTYQCKSGTFLASWSVSKTRNNTFRDVEMKVFNEAGDLLTEKLSSAPEVNVRNIGLDYDQFVKSILLCQGEFAKFLQSDKNKRAELLEKITGTRQFRKIGKKAYDEFIRRRKLVEERSLLIDEVSKKLLNAEERASLLAAIKQSTDNIKALEQKLDEAKASLAKTERLRQLRDKISEQEQKKIKAEQSLKSFDEEYGEALKHYDKLFGYREQLADYGRLKQAVAEADNKINGHRELIATCDKGMEELVLELREWVGEEVSVGDYVLHLRAFRDKVRDARKKCEDQKQLLKTSYGRLMPLLGSPAFQQEKAMFRPGSGNEQLLIKLAGRKDNEAAAYKVAMATYGFSEEGMETLKAGLNDAMAELAQLKLEVRSYKQHDDQVKQLVRKIGDGRQQLAGFDIPSLKVAMEEAQVAYEKAVTERDQLLRAEKLDELRKSLKDGEPCPLCGSAHHPYLHGFAEDVIHSADTLSATKALFDQRKKLHDDAVSKVAEINNGMERNKELLEGLNKEKERIGKLVEGYKLKLGIDKVQSEDKVQELIEGHKKKLNALESCISFRQWEPQAIQVEQEVQLYDTLLADLARMEDASKQMYAGHDLEADCTHRETEMNTFLNKQHTAREQMKSTGAQLEKDNVALNALNNGLGLALKEAGYNGIEEANALLIPETRQKELLVRKTALAQDVHGSGLQLDLLRDQWNSENAGEAHEMDIEKQRLVVNQVEGQLGVLREGLKEENARLFSDDERLAQAASYGEERRKLQDALRPWEMLNKLIGDATGNKFNNMAQELTLGHLLILANQRLGKLHSRYKILPPADDDDLRVEDTYMGNEVRTVRSLSGGETFVLSLALALGLSDLASRDIRIDSLFIDEGFGSLDPETLEEAMSTLEQLQSESNKTVGIISHVDSLKERIYTQIRLAKSNNGFSTLSIFPETGDADEAEL